jgi:hypothetical protein
MYPLVSGFGRSVCFSSQAPKIKAKKPQLKPRETVDSVTLSGTVLKRPRLISKSLPPDLGDLEIAKLMLEYKHLKW